MSVSDALHDWKELAESAMELKLVQTRARELQAAYENAREEFELGMEELDEEERATILSIMSIYEHNGSISHQENNSSESARDGVRNWLVAKVGNEGAEGIRWGDVMNAWVAQYPNTPTSVLQGAFHQCSELFSKSGMGKNAVLRLTPQGQSLFRDAE